MYPIKTSEVHPLRADPLTVYFPFLLPWESSFTVLEPRPTWPLIQQSGSVLGAGKTDMNDT